MEFTSSRKIELLDMVYDFDDKSYTIFLTDFKNSRIVHEFVNEQKIWHDCMLLSIINSEILKCIEETNLLTFFSQSILFDIEMHEKGIVQIRKESASLHIMKKESFYLLGLCGLQKCKIFQKDDFEFLERLLKHNAETSGKYLTLR